MRVLTGYNIVAEIGEHTYARSPISQALTAPATADLNKHMLVPLSACSRLSPSSSSMDDYHHQFTNQMISYRFDSSWGCIGKMPAYLADIGYQNPDRPDNTLSHYATGTDFFAYIRSDEARQIRFNSAMKGAGQQLAESPVPAAALDSQNTDENVVLMVDVGGGIGQVTEKVMQENSHLKGRYVLQDLGPIVEEARAKQPKYDVVEYDFFTPQPIKGMQP